MPLRIISNARNAELNELVTQAGANPIIRIYSGSQPASFGGSIGASILLVTLTVTGALGTVSGGVLTLNAIPANTAGASGSADWFRILNNAGSVVVIDGEVSVIGGTGHLQLANLSIASGQSVNLSGPNTITAGNP